MPSSLEISDNQSFDPNQFRQILPRAATLEWVKIENYCQDLYHEEYQYIASAVKKRRDEFSSGRLCARRALTQLNREPCPIPAGRHRQPLWPGGFAGSISHDGSYAVAAVAPCMSTPLLGIDLAVKDALDPSAVEMTCTPREIADLTKLSAFELGCDPFKLVFSLKEALFKCLFPVVHRIFDFKEASIELLSVVGKAEISLEKGVLPAGSDFSLQARYCCSGEYIFTAVWVDKEEFR